MCPLKGKAIQEPALWIPLTALRLIGVRALCISLGVTFRCCPTICYTFSSYCRLVCTLILHSFIQKRITIASHRVFLIPLFKMGLAKILLKDLTMFFTQALFAVSWNLSEIVSISGPNASTAKNLQWLSQSSDSLLLSYSS